MSKKPLIHYSLFIILVVASFLRLYKLGSYPALNADEAAVGYNAYSLLETGKDEHGNAWPIHFQSFNDYKPGLYVYLVMPFIKVFGLNEWAVRLPNALLGIASVYLIYLLVKELSIVRFTRINKRINADACAESPITNHQSLALLSAFLLAASPWHLHFSRGGWEVNTATFFILAGVYSFLRYLRNRKILSFEFSVLSFAFSMYTYHSARIIAPLLVLGLLVIYRRELFSNINRNFKLQRCPSFWLDGLPCGTRLVQNQKLIHYRIFVFRIAKLFPPAVIGLMLLAPLIIDFTKSDVVSRAAGVGLFADTGPLSRINEQRGEHTDPFGIDAKILHNKLTNYGLAFLENWPEHYHGEFLFLSGDTVQRNRVPETGQMHLFEIITIVFGLYVLFSRVIRNTKYVILVLYWLFLAPIPAALTFQSPHALRAQNMVIPLTIISAIGLISLSELIKKLRVTGSGLFTKLLRYTLYIILYTCISWSFFRYLHQYYTHMSKEYPYSSQYGVKELVDYVKSVNTEKDGYLVILASEQSERVQNQIPNYAGMTKELLKYKNIVVTNRYDQPYILFLFYSKYPPEKFQKEHALTPRDKYGFSTVESFDNFVFRSIDWDRDKLAYPNSLIIGTDEEIPDAANVVKRIYGSNDFLYFKVVEN